MITITSTETAKILVKGTDIEIPSVLARVGGTISFEGKTFPVVLKLYKDATACQANEEMEDIDGFDIIKTFDLSNNDAPLTYKAQTIQVAHTEYKTYLKQLGLTATISGI